MSIPNSKSSGPYKILTINPGSTSTKIAVYHDEQSQMVKSISHSATDLAKFGSIMQQYQWRKQLILDELEANGIAIDFDAVVGRGCLAKPVEGGVYDITMDMVDAAREAEHQHACDLGCVLAYDIAKSIDGCRPLTADPGVVDELCPEARISGSPQMPRISIWHALNQRAVARKYAARIGSRYEDLNLIICHLGGGISVCAHCKGRAVDAPNCLDGEGPLSPERAGTLPAAALVKLCYSGKYTEEQLLRRIAGQAGLTAHLGTNDVRQIMQLVENGDEKATMLVDAMCYHTAKSITAQGAVLYGKVDAILLTGGMAYSDYIVNKVKERVEFLAPVFVYPGESEMEALAQNGLMVLRGEAQTKKW